MLIRINNKIVSTHDLGRCAFYPVGSIGSHHDRKPLPYPMLKITFLDKRVMILKKAEAVAVWAQLSESCVAHYGTDDGIQYPGMKPIDTYDLFANADDVIGVETPKVNYSQALEDLSFIERNATTDDPQDRETLANCIQTLRALIGTEPQEHETAQA